MEYVHDITEMLVTVIHSACENIYYLIIMLETPKSWCKQDCTVANKGINFCSVYGETNEDQDRDMYI